MAVADAEVPEGQDRDAARGARECIARALRRLLEALIYEPATNADAVLVGVEFIVPYATVPKTAPAPELFGQKFQQNDVFSVWGLHVWTHRANPSGVFSPWNPRVHC